VVVVDQKISNIKRRVKLPASGLTKTTISPYNTFILKQCLFLDSIHGLYHMKHDGLGFGVGDADYGLDFC
tara:strand:- start:288 stop:497 length:210 start_codon:yes stop_codon:yes gene_type:complete